MEPLPETPRSADEIFARLECDVFSNILNILHPRFFAFVPGPSNFVSVMADALAAGFNVFNGSWLGGSGAAALELTVIDWLRRLCGLPEQAGGLFVSGGSMANLTALVAAQSHEAGGSDAWRPSCISPTRPTLRWSAHCT